MAKNPTHHILLGKIDSVDAEHVKMTFLIVDTGANPTIISRPELSMNYGQKGQVELKENDRTLEITVIADHQIKLLDLTRISPLIEPINQHWSIKYQA